MNLFFVYAANWNIKWNVSFIILIPEIACSLLRISNTNGRTLAGTLPPPSLLFRVLKRERSYTPCTGKRENDKTAAQLSRFSLLPQGIAVSDQRAFLTFSLEFPKVAAIQI